MTLPKGRLRETLKSTLEAMKTAIEFLKKKKIMRLMSPISFLEGQKEHAAYDQGA